MTVEISDELKGELVAFVTACSELDDAATVLVDGDFEPVRAIAAQLLEDLLGEVENQSQT